jgi:hypothetical protein
MKKYSAGKDEKFYVDIFSNTPEILEHIQQGTEEIHIGRNGSIQWKRDSQNNRVPLDEENEHRLEMSNKWLGVSLDALSRIDSLHTLFIEHIGVTDFTPLSKIKCLKHLRMNRLRIDALDLSALRLCERLESIEILGTMRESLVPRSPHLFHIDLSPLSKCKTLRKIRVSSTDACYVSLPSIPLLEVLDLSRNHITTRLMGLIGDLEDPRTLDLSQLEGCDNLSEINLEWNSIWAIDLSPLSLLQIPPDRTLKISLLKNGALAEGYICADGVLDDPRFKISMDAHVQRNMRFVDGEGNPIKENHQRAI